MNLINSPGLRISMCPLLCVQGWMGRPSRRAIALLVAASLLSSGCGTFGTYFGVRPDSPAITPSSNVQTECARRDRIAGTLLALDCEGYLSHVEWAQQLNEAYRTRATMNEWSIYLAGTIALGALSAVGGLGIAAAASTTTIGLIGVSSGFASGFFGLLNNSARAGFYTVAANEIASALAEAARRVGTPPTAQSYTAATVILHDKVEAAAIWLETKRSEAAAAAAAAAQKEQATQQMQDKLALVEKAALVAIDPASGKAQKPATLTTSGVDLTKFKGKIQALIDGESAKAEVKSADTVEVTMPSKPEGKDRVVVRLKIDGVIIPGGQSYTYEKP
ncbi:MAG: IPT/TIG domain-containing protein [Candidatus Rokubacteria bacterium]|nr:IPT/TIG domain-containing protein [Candidatus Rokubacteria bacterium]